MRYRVSGLAAVVAIAILAACGGDGAGGGTGQAAETVGVVLGAAGCAPARIELDEGRARISVSNPTSSSVTNFEVRQGDVVVAKVSNVLGGLTRVVEVRLREGEYGMRCFGGGVDGRGTIVVVRGG